MLVPNEVRVPLAVEVLVLVEEPLVSRDRRVLGLFHIKFAP